MGNLEPHFPLKRLSTNTLTIPHSPRNTCIRFRVGSEKDVAYGSSFMKVFSKCVHFYLSVGMLSSSKPYFGKGPHSSRYKNK